MAMFASEWSQIPWSFTLHRWDIVENNLLLDKVKSAQTVRFISEDGLRMAQELGMARSANVRVIHMGVEVPANIPPPSAGRAFLCPARLVEVKGHRHLLEAWKTLQTVGVHAQLLLAGDGPLRTALTLQAAALGLGESVRFLGVVPHEKLLERYEQGGIAAVVLPSVDIGGGCHEGIPVALMEAMSYGIPVIGTRTGGTAELVQNGTGLMVEPGNSEELAVAMRSMIDNPEDAQRLGRMGRRHVEAEFNVRRTTAELVDTFEGPQDIRDESSMDSTAAQEREIHHA
jgi:glycosyltransferase involved in cell wall biosynthesis